MTDDGFTSTERAMRDDAEETVTITILRKDADNAMRNLSLSIPWARRIKRACVDAVLPPQPIPPPMPPDIGNVARTPDEPPSVRFSLSDTYEAITLPTPASVPSIEDGVRQIAEAITARVLAEVQAR